MKDIATHLRMFREKRNFTQEYVAIQLNITQRAYSKIENGETGISIDRFLTIVKILQADISPLLKDRDIDIIGKSKCDECQLFRQLNLMNDVVKQKIKIIDLLIKVSDSK